MTQPVNYQSSPPGDPRAALNGPGMALMIFGYVGVGLAAIGILLNILGIGLGAAQGGQEAAANMLSGGVGVASGIIGMIVGVIVGIGGGKMRKGQSYGFAMTAAILAMIPCISPCCLIGLPLGIWALVVLMKPEVKAAFTA